MILDFTPDALIFDIDGVLLNVEKSFPEVIRAAVAECWSSVCGGVSDSGGYTDEHERVLKRHGAFNDDYDIAWVLLAMSAASGAAKLSEAFPSAEKLYSELESYSGDVPEWCVSRYADSVSRSYVREYCRRLYFGTDS
ncbi:MAG: HAD family hydrolase, partial [Synergistaceae bacterium]